MASFMVEILGLVPGLGGDDQRCNCCIALCIVLLRRYCWLKGQQTRSSC